MKPGYRVSTPHGVGILLTHCVKRAAWWVIFGTWGEIVEESDIMIVQE